VPTAIRPGQAGSTAAAQRFATGLVAVRAARNPRLYPAWRRAYNPAHDRYAHRNRHSNYNPGVLMPQAPE